MYHDFTDVTNAAEKREGIEKEKKQHPKTITDYTKTKPTFTRYTAAVHEVALARNFHINEIIHLQVASQHLDRVRLAVASRNVYSNEKTQGTRRRLKYYR